MKRSYINIYFASAIQNKFLINSIAVMLPTQISNIRIISKWYNLAPIDNIKLLAGIDLKRGVEKSDIVIGFYPYGKHGTITELTSAFYMGKRIIYCRTNDYKKEDPMIIGLFDNKRCRIVSNIHSKIDVIEIFKKELLK